MNKPIEPIASDSPQFYAMPVSRYVLLSLITFGFYQLYWFYKNWKMYMQTSGVKIRPVAGTFFSIFYAYPLFKLIESEAVNKGYPKRVSAKILAIIFIVAYVVSTVISGTKLDPLVVLLLSTLILIISTLVLVPVQAASNYVTSVAKNPIRTGLSGGEIIIVSIGVLVLILIVVSAFIPETNALRASALQF